MAIGFMPTDEDTDARYERLNRILLELYEVVFHLVHRTPTPPEPATRTAPSPRVRPASDSTAPRLPDLLCGSSALPAPPRRRVSSLRSTPASPSCSAQHLCRTFSDIYDRSFPDDRIVNPADDEVFLISSPIQTPRTAPPPPRQRRRRKRSISLKDSKKRTKAKSEDATDVVNWRDDGQTTIEDIVQTPDNKEQDTVDSSASSEVEKVSESESSLISTLLSTRLGGSLWTAVVIVVGWRLLTTKR